MNPTTILERIRRLFTSDASEHLDSIRDAFVAGTLKEPMSDQELARAIREFRSAPVSDGTLAKLSQRLVAASVPRDV